MKYTVKIEPFEYKLEWREDDEGDWLLFFALGTNPPRYWGLVCVHHPTPKIVCDGSPVWPKGPVETVEDAKREAEIRCLTDLARALIRVKENR